VIRCHKKKNIEKNENHNRATMRQKVRMARIFNTIIKIEIFVKVSPHGAVFVVAVAVLPILPVTMMMSSILHLLLILPLPLPLLLLRLFLLLLILLLLLLLLFLLLLLSTIWPIWQVRKVALLSAAASATQRPVLSDIGSSPGRSARVRMASACTRQPVPR